MSAFDRQPDTHDEPLDEPSPLSMPPAHFREPSADDQEIDISDSIYDVPLDDSDRLREDAETLKD